MVLFFSSPSSFCRRNLRIVGQSVFVLRSTGWGIGRWMAFGNSGSFRGSIDDKQKHFKTCTRAELVFFSWRGVNIVCLLKMYLCFSFDHCVI